MKPTVTNIILFLIGLQISLYAQEVQDQFFETDGITIRYQIAGEGPPVILLHGYMSNINHKWENVIPLLAEDYMVIAMDLRGHGQSSKPESVDT